MANASSISVFQCKIEQEIAFVEVITDSGQAVFKDSVSPTILTATGRGGFSNDQAAISFNGDGRNPIINLGGVEYRCEVATGAPPPVPDNAGSGNGLKSKLYNLVNVQGQSLGGKLRVGPGVNYGQAGSLGEGTFITIVSNSGVRFDGYDWFEVDAGNGQRGFQWGGIMCSNGQQIAGIFQQCRNRQVEQPQETSSLTVPGLSLGGKLRSGPGTNHAQVGSLQEGIRITILRNTGVRFNGYDWFEIAAGNGQRGFQWGGIMCSNGQAIAGIFQQCGVPAVPASTQNESAGQAGGWMAFALGKHGTFGHGAAPSKAGAEENALINCGNATCQVTDITQGRCHALAMSRAGNGVGSGETEQAAQNFAMGWCSNSGGNGCEIMYTYCQ